MRQVGGHSSSRCTGLSLWRPLLLRSTGSRRAGSVIVAHGPSHSAACGILPDQGPNPCPLHWQADSQPLRHQGSPIYTIFNQYYGETECKSHAEIYPLPDTHVYTLRYPLDVEVLNQLFLIFSHPILFLLLPSLPFPLPSPSLGHPFSPEAFGWGRTKQASAQRSHG